MLEPKTAPYGGWRSPITPELLTRGTPARDFPCLVDGILYWQESRPAEEGRVAVVARAQDGVARDVQPYPMSARSKVHEYGGRAWLVAENHLFFILQDDQRLYRLPLDGTTPEPEALTPVDEHSRYAEPVLDARHRRILCVRERHFEPEANREPENSLVAIPVDEPGKVLTLVTGSDFYAYPRPSPSGDRLAWLTWNHPQMPWDGTELWCAPLSAHGEVGEPEKIAGDTDESVFQPAWSPAGELHFVSDHSGWWNLYRHRNGDNQPLFPMEADFATPLWALGMSTYGFIDEHRIACLFTQSGDWHLGLLHADTGKMDAIATPYSTLSSLSCDKTTAVFIGAAPDRSGEVAVFSPLSKAVKTATPAEADDIKPWISRPRPVSFPSGDGDIAHGFFYPPRNPDFQAPEGDRPPLIVMCHGGPTGATSTALNYKIQYWTSRGFALLDVNYRGSTGYGRDYREKLAGQWGVADVQDVAAGAAYLAEEGAVNPDQMLIRGSSAGGYTVLAALTFTDTFRAGASLYGIGELEALARDTHKFESRYLDKLVGPYPEERERYRQRSPVNHIDRLQCPVIFLQGLEDKVVPPDQARQMVDALRAKRIPVAYLEFPDEGHGFRKADNIKRALEAELAFYRRVLGIDAGEDLPELVIENLGN